jgi:hypothetical protein
MLVGALMGFSRGAHLNQYFFATFLFCPDVPKKFWAHSVQPIQKKLGVKVWIRYTD